MQGLGHLTPGETRLDPCDQPTGIDLDRVHQRHVDHHASVARGVSGDAVAAATHGDGQVLGSGKGDGGGHIDRIGAADDQRRPAVEYGVVDRARPLIQAVLRPNYLTLQPSA